MTDPTYPDYLQLRTGQAPPPDPHEAGVRVYADNAGALRSVQSDGTDAPVGGGGSQPVVLGPFNIAHDTPGLDTGITIHTPAVGDALMDAWVFIDTPWDGTTPTFDLLDGVDGAGLFQHTNGAIDAANFSTGPIFGGSSLVCGSFGVTTLVNAGIAGGILNSGQWPALWRFATPLLACVSQDGSSSGGPTGATQGSARIFILVATPPS